MRNKKIQSDGLSVLMLPDYSGSNPYQHELQSGLEANGISVTISNSIGMFAVLTAVLAQERRPDVVHLHWLEPFTINDSQLLTILSGFRLTIELVILRILGVTVIWTIHNLVEHRQRAPQLERAIKHIVVRLCHGSIVHCTAAREAAIREYRLPRRVENKFSVIPHGHYIDVYPNDRSSESAKNRLEIPFDESTVVFLYFGLIRPYKNVSGLIEAFKNLENEHARLLIVGNPLHDSLEMGIRDRCADDDRIHTVLEYVPDDEIQDYMNATDAVVLPFEKVLTSGSALLAMSFGNAVIAPEIGCVGDVLDPDGGFTYDPDEDRGLLTAMEQALNADLETMGRYNYQKAEQYDWKRIGQQTRDIYLTSE